MQDATLEDGGGSKPGYSLRTLCRALMYARAALPVYGLHRALWDGAAMAFLTQLAPSCAKTLEKLMRTQLLPGLTSLKARCRSTATNAASSAVPWVVMLVCGEGRGGLWRL